MFRWLTADRQKRIAYGDDIQYRLSMRGSFAAVKPENYKFSEKVALFVDLRVRN